MRPLFGHFAQVHMVGIGGVGMEGVARILLQLGCRVSGSDQCDSSILGGLRREGVEVFAGHGTARVEKADLVVYSAAVPEDNLELERARNAGIPLVKRAELLGELTRTRYTIGVAGSHGKTTTAAMVAAICRRAGLDPATAVGGRVDGRLEAGWGEGDVFVVEADEFDRSFLQLHPRLALVTGIDAEHLDCYGDLAAVRRAFAQFLDRLPFYGQAILAGDNTGVQTLVADGENNWLTYGLGSGNDYCAKDLTLRQWGSRFAAFKYGEELGSVELRVPGEYNICNALGAAAVAHSLGIDFDTVSAALRDFSGVERRFERKGEVGGVLVVDDYAHHPVEIAAVLDAARCLDRRLIAVFQPHLYSRTQDLMGDFARALMGADRVVLTAVYGAREEAIPGVEADGILRQMHKEGFVAAEYVPLIEDLAAHLAKVCQPDDMVLTMGAGNIDRIAEELLCVLDA